MNKITNYVYKFKTQKLIEGKNNSEMLDRMTYADLAHYYDWLCWEYEIGGIKENDINISENKEFSIVEHMINVLKEYKKQLKTNLTPRQKVINGILEIIEVLRLDKD